MDKTTCAFRRLLARLRTQEGSLLIEVMIGAVMVVMVSGAVLNGLEGAQDTGEKNKARTTSAALAQQDQERLRAMPVDELSNYHNTRSVDVAGATYNVDSRSEWVRDDNGVVSCINDSSQAQYMKITSTVTSNVNRDTPLKQTSLVSPPRGTFSVDTGTAAVQVVDRDENPLVGVRVDITGPQSLSDVTNALGCVVFGYIPEGPWELEISSLGLVGWDGESPFTSDIGVVGGATVLTKLYLDEPSSIDASFETKVGADVRADTSTSVSVANSKLPAQGGWKAFTSATPQPTLTADKLFPFADGYGVYAGSCEANNPSKYDPEYFTTSTGAAAFVVPNPGGSVNAVVRKPAINVEVRKLDTSTLDPVDTIPVADARVFVKTADASCTEAYPMQLTNAAGALPNPGFPFGNYTVCADDGTGGKVEQLDPAVANTSPDGTPALVLTLSGSTERCA